MIKLIFFIFRHLLYGLLEYLFIKCDRATAGLEQPNCQDADSKIKQYLQHYQQKLVETSANGIVEKSILNQVDILMIHSIQVSRFGNLHIKREVS